MGRAFYHLAQRRGFLSSRKAGKSAADEKEEGSVKSGIRGLREEMAAAGARTLGEYFSRLNPHEKRIRERWTARQMSEDEFTLICDAQQSHHSGTLSDKFIKRLHSALFRQRPLKSQRHLIAECELEPPSKRAASALLPMQRFRLLQTVKNLRLVESDFRERSLTSGERQDVLEELDNNGDLTFAAARRLLRLPRTSKFNIEAGGEKKIIGNRSGAKLLKAIGQRWLDLSQETKERIVAELISTGNDKLVARRAQESWGCSGEEAQAVSQIRLEDGHGSLSTRAMRKVMPLLEEGMTFAEARRKLYPEKFQPTEPTDFLPPLRAAEKNLRNPALERALTELRKVVNGVVRRYGKPAAIHIETARELKQPRWKRAEQSKRMRTNESARKNAATQILAERPEIRVSRGDKLKYLLAVECNWRCAYTGEAISMFDLFGPEPRFDIEHIIPKSRCLDDSYMNKTLCLSDHNRHVKREKTPWEAYASDSETYEAILQRVRAFTGDRPTLEAKLRRFEQREVDTGHFIARQLNDTRYASRLGADYLGTLYGGRNDAEGKQRIFAIAGQVTAEMRRCWDLNAVLNDGPSADGGVTPKSRDDHRHHAVDALVVALTNSGTVKRLSELSAQAGYEGRGRFDLESPWNDFVDSVREAIAGIVVSHRVDRRANGQMHNETIYGPERDFVGADGKQKKVRHIRRALAQIKKTATIVHKNVRAAVEAKLELLGNSPKAFEKEENLPVLGGIKIRKARVRETVHAARIGEGARLRRVALKSNHHLEVFAELDSDGNEKKWSGKIVTTYDALQRKRQAKPLVNRDHGPGTKFKFSLCGGDTIRLDHPKHGGGLYIVRTISQEAEKDGRRPDPIIECVRQTDARLQKDIKAGHDWLKSAVNSLRKAGCEKVMVGPSGKTVTAHD